MGNNKIIIIKCNQRSVVVCYAYLSAFVVCHAPSLCVCAVCVCRVFSHGGASERIRKSDVNCEAKEGIQMM